MAIIVAIIITIYSWYNKTESFDAKVYSVNVQQCTQGDKDGFYTTYFYIVSTSHGTYNISPGGILHSSDFGTLEKDSIYHFFTRGYRISLIGVYPYIITAKPLRQ